MRPKEKKRNSVIYMFLQQVLIGQSSEIHQICGYVRYEDVFSVMLLAGVLTGLQCFVIDRLSVFEGSSDASNAIVIDSAWSRARLPSKLITGRFGPFNVCVPIWSQH